MKDSVISPDGKLEQILPSVGLRSHGLSPQYRISEINFDISKMKEVRINKDILGQCECTGTLYVDDIVFNGGLDSEFIEKSIVCTGCDFCEPYFNDTPAED